MPIDNNLTALQIIRQSGSIIRSDLACQMDISLSLASKITAELLRQGVIQEIGRSEATSAGRPSDLLAIHPLAGYAVGLDIDSNRHIALLTNLTGEIIASIDETACPVNNRDEILVCLQSLVERVVKHAQIQPKQVFGVGVGLRRTVDPITGVAHGWPGASPWEATWAEFPVRDALQSLLPYPHILLDDIVHALGIAESRYGQGSQQEDFLYILADTGIGMAIMLGGVPYIGLSHIAGELGHIPVPGDQTPCECGSIGCLENLASTGSLLRRLHARIEQTQVQSSFRWNKKEPDIASLLNAAEDGDKLCYQLMNDAGEEFGQVLSIVINLLGPRLVVIGGALSASQIFLDAARRTIKMRALEKASRIVTLLPSQLDHLAGARGAATMVLNALFESPEKNLLALVG